MFLLGAGGLLTAAAGIGMYFGVGRSPHALPEQIILTSVCLAGFGLGLYLILSVLRSKIVLFEDRIEIHDVSRVRTIRRDDLAGWRLIRHTTPAGLTLAPKRANGNTISLALVFDVDSFFQDWLAGLDNLDAEDTQKSF